MAAGRRSQPAPPSTTTRWIAERVAAFEDTVLRYCGDEATVRTVTGDDPPAGGVAAPAVGLAEGHLHHVGDGGRDGARLGDYKPGLAWWRRSAAAGRRAPITSWSTSTGSPLLAGLKIACALYAEVRGQDRSGSGRDQRSSGDVVYLVMPDWANDRPTGWTDVDATLNAAGPHPGVA